jgi:hypothetical protein
MGFEASYKQYLILRGYDPSASRLLVLRRALVDCWGEPGFHQFWRVWNPGVGHILFKLYRLLGGNHNRVVATLLVFAMCGAFHDLMVMLIFQRPFLAFTAAFFSSGLLSLTNRLLDPLLRQHRWPSSLNAMCNAACLAGSVHLAVQLQMAIYP